MLKRLAMSLGLFMSVGCSQSAQAPKYQGGGQQGSSTKIPGGQEGMDGTASEGGAAEPGTDAGMQPAPSPSPSPTTPPQGGAIPGGPATGSVTVTLTLTPPNPAGPYRNRGHVRSLWITDANNTYIKTVHAYAATRAVHLKRWFRFTGSTIDVASGATQTTPAAGVPLSINWDLKDRAGAQAKTGDYKLWLEFTEANTPALDQGKMPGDPMQAIDGVNGYEYHVVPFSVTPQGTTKTDATNPVFKDVSISHKP
jgi:hypothetical protein